MQGIATDTHVLEPQAGWGRGKSGPQMCTDVHSAVKPHTGRGGEPLSTDFHRRTQISEGKGGGAGGDWAGGGVAHRFSQIRTDFRGKRSGKRPPLSGSEEWDSWRRNMGTR